MLLQRLDVRALGDRYRASSLPGKPQLFYVPMANVKRVCAGTREGESDTLAFTGLEPLEGWSCTVVL